MIRQFMREASRRGHHSNMIFAEKGWSIKKERTKKITLSFTELKTLASLDLSENDRLNRVRDLFLIGAYSGLRFSDFTRIKPEHIIREEGLEMIELFTQKTDTEVVIPLLPELKAVLEKHNYKSPAKISNQKMNDYLKELCRKAGLNEKIIVKKSVAGRIVEEEKEKWEKITPHTARRSFATNFYELGFTAAELMPITGHSTERQFMDYINIGKKRNAKNIVKRAKMMMDGRHLKVV